MKAVILSGGKGTRLSEETQSRPKPLVEAGGQPLLWHIMQNYARFDVTEFIILVGYRGQQIREYFADYWLHQSDVTFDLSAPEFTIHKIRSLPWKVTVIDTGLETQTGGRLAKIKDLLDEDFFLTYGDGVGDVDINQLLSCHKSGKGFATLTAVQPPARFGALELTENSVTGFVEKPVGDGGWVNGGFFCLSPKVFEYLDDDSCSFEGDALPRIAQSGNLKAYKHHGFWQPVDTLRDLARLEEAIAAKRLPWI
jgi:glucose-1-phosphate cytidylyltransferase